MMFAYLFILHLKVNNNIKSCNKDYVMLLFDVLILNWFAIICFVSYGLDELLNNMFECFCNAMAAADSCALR